ncbi:MAG: fructosamine kinase family protein [Spirochaetaceae bacterium]|nr:fructosamine kinase family protein [Spirochaetaceae bacterium]
MNQESNYFTSISNAITTLFGENVQIERGFPVQGGDINKSYGIQLSNGNLLFMKSNEKSKVDFFVKEAHNLKAIAKTNTIATPKILGFGTEDGEEVGYSFLLLDFVELGNLDADFWEKFAENLGNMHKSTTEAFISKEDLAEGKIFGFYEDNYIGKTKQINSPKATWIDFFRENRLDPQFKMAEKYFSTEDSKLIDKLLDNLADFLIEPRSPSLLHGDLWAGNVMCDTKPQAMLIDPACYVGHPEADIAMTELFGGFSDRFYAAYKNTGLLQPQYEERRDLYNLYHLLNHLNMFGESYLPAVKSILEKYVG